MKPSTKEIAEGKIKEIVGKAVGNRDLEAEGKVEILDGKIQEKLSHVEKVLARPKIFLNSSKSKRTK
jgi:uncharacterized protein YjbJ (UPF0337 family)